jgi:glycosyltransferase involved in cell wall biosynthesis
MRILQLCHKPPLPSLDGGCRAMDAMTRGLLQAGHTVKVLTACTEKHPWKPELIDTNYLLTTHAEAVFIDTSLNKVDAFASIVTGDSYNISRFHSADLERALTRILRTRVFDLILFESLFTAPYLKTVRRYSDGLTILRAHNVEHRIWQHLAKETPQFTRKMYLNWLAEKLEDYEIAVLDDFDGIAGISAEDLVHFRELGCELPMQLVPFGLDKAEWPKDTSASANHVFHLGAMDWRPNQQGVRWFVNRVWPLVRQRIPTAELRLAGRNFASSWTFPDNMGIRLLGEVESAWDMMTDNGIMVIPLLSGSGMRIKAIEALAAGRPIVSTPIGIEGIPAEDGKHVMIAATPEKFAACIVDLLENPETARKMGFEGRKWAQEHFENNRLIASMISNFQEVFQL